MNKNLAKIGMKVRIWKYSVTEKKGWAPCHASRHIGLVCEIVKIHPEHDALNLKLTDPIVGEVQWWWYHIDDIQPITENKFHKKVNFDPNNLVVGV